MKTLIAAFAALAVLPVAAFGAQGHHYGWTYNRGHHYGWSNHHHYARHWSRRHHGYAVTTTTTYTSYGMRRRHHFVSYGPTHEEWQYGTPSTRVYHSYTVRRHRTRYYMTHTPPAQNYFGHEEWQYGGGR